MSKYVIDERTLTGLGNAIRSVTGSNKRFTPDEMIEEVTNILNATTYILVDQDGNEYPAVWVESDTVCNATANDIRKGSVAITPDGVIEGTKEIPAYHTVEGMRVIAAGKNFTLEKIGKASAFSKLQALFCTDSVAADKVCINTKVYAVNSNSVLSNVTVDDKTQSINFGMTNDTDTPYIIRYFTYREEY